MDASWGRSCGRLTANNIWVKSNARLANASSALYPYNVNDSMYTRTSSKRTSGGGIRSDLRQLEIWGKVAQTSQQFFQD